MGEPFYLEKSLFSHKSYFVEGVCLEISGPRSAERSILLRDLKPIYSHREERMILASILILLLGTLCNYTAYYWAVHLPPGLGFLAAFVPGGLGVGFWVMSVTPLKKRTFTYFYFKNGAEAFWMIAGKNKIQDQRAFAEELRLRIVASRT